MDKKIDSNSLQEDELSNDKKENPRMQHKFTWADKYQPKALNSFICHRAIADKVVAGDMNHLIFEGFPGIGKRTMALALLREIFGPDISKSKEEVLALDLKSVLKSGVSSTIQIRAQISSKHIEVNLSESDMKGYAAEVALLLVKETHNASRKQPFLQAKAIIFHLAENISKTAQSQIRSFLENSEGRYKVIFCCSDVSNKLQILKPICRVIHLPLPSNMEIVGVLNFIAEQEDIELPHILAQTIAENSKNCLRQAIRSFEATWLADYPFKEGQYITTGWEDEIAMIAKSIIQEPSPHVLFLVRKRVGNLMDHHICGEFVLSNLVAEMKKHVNIQAQLDLESLYQDYNPKQNEEFCLESSHKDELLCNRRSRKNDIIFLRIEEFAARFMSYYKIKRVQLQKSH